MTERTQRRALSKRGDLSALHKKIEELEGLQRTHEQARAALLASEQEKSAILDAMFEYVVLADPDYRIVWTNGAVNRQFRSRPEDLKGQPCYSVFFKSSRRCSDCPAEEVRRTGVPRTVHDKRFFGRRWTTRYYPIGKSGNVLGVYTDITEQKSVEEALREEKRQKERMERELLEIGEQERRIIGRELHDGLGQLLTGIALKSKAIAQELEKRGLPENESVKHLTDLANEAIGQTKQLIRGLMPVGLGTGGIREALQELARNIIAIYGISCFVTTEGDGYCLEGVGADQLYRIAGEAALNAAKHSGAKQITIRLRQEAGGVVLSVEDDGTGFTPGDKQGDGMGLNIMAFRARMIDASFRIAPNTPAGTVVACRFPNKAAIPPDALKGNHRKRNSRHAG